MTTHRFVGQVRRALDLETDAVAGHWAAEAVGAFLAAVDGDLLRSEILAELPDRLASMVSRADPGVRPEPELMATLLGCTPDVADHLLRVVWTLLGDLVSPADVARMKVSFSNDVVARLEQYEWAAEQESDSLLGDVADYRYESEETPEGATLSGGDLDAAWNDAEGSGEETVGGSVVTPDQDVVEEIGEALGVTYRYDEPLRPVEKEAERDHPRWEMNPASSEDFRSRAARRKSTV